MTRLTFEEAVALIEGARSFADLTDSSPGAAVGDGLDAYRMLVKIVHPDVAPAGRTSAATAAFARLSVLWGERDGRVLTTKRRSYRVGAVVAAGDVANLYAVDGGIALLKLPRVPADNDLMTAETTALERLARHGESKYREYAPRLMESFIHQDGGGVRRKANILRRSRGFVSLAEVATAIPDGLDPRDVAWMWRRLLVALGWAHRAGVVHGAVLPEHVLVHPAAHGLVLVDWCYSVAPGERITALVGKHRAHYPPEVTGRAPASTATDIFMATGTMFRLTKDPPKQLRRFADGCLYDAPRMRPQDAWQLLAEFDELLANLYGPRRFREFALPAIH